MKRERLSDLKCARHQHRHHHPHHQLHFHSHRSRDFSLVRLLCILFVGLNSIPHNPHHLSFPLRCDQVPRLSARPRYITVRATNGRRHETYFTPFKAKSPQSFAESCKIQASCSTSITAQLRRRWPHGSTKEGTAAKGSQGSRGRILVVPNRQL